MSASIDAAQVERFRHDLDRLCPGGAPILFAVSGGPDSMAMLALAHAAAPARVRAATVDHGLRPESATEARLVGDWCSNRAITHTVLKVEAAPQGNLQSWARNQRYSLLSRCALAEGAGLLATGHHADDQAETFLMRAARGSGLSGLAAIRSRLEEDVFWPSSVGAKSDRVEDGWVLNAEVRKLVVLRPLLGWRRAELRALCISQGLPFVDDPSNDNDRFDRTRVRSLLSDAGWLDPIAVGRSAEYLAEADRDLREVSDWVYSERRAGNDGEEVIDMAGLPRGVRRIIARTAIENVVDYDPRRDRNWTWAISIEPLLDALDAGRSATQAGVLVEPRGTVWHFRLAPPRRTPKTTANGPK